MITASSTITQIAAPLARIPPLSWRDTRRVTDGRAGLIARRAAAVSALHAARPFPAGAASS